MLLIKTSGSTQTEFSADTYLSPSLTTQATTAADLQLVPNWISIANNWNNVCTRFKNLVSQSAPNCRLFELLVLFANWRNPRHDYDLCNIWDQNTQQYKRYSRIESRLNFASGNMEQATQQHDAFMVSNKIINNTLVSSTAAQAAWANSIRELGIAGTSGVSSFITEITNSLTYNGSGTISYVGEWQWGQVTSLSGLTTCYVFRRTFDGFMIFYFPDCADNNMYYNNTPPSVGLPCYPDVSSIMSLSTKPIRVILRSPDGYINIGQSIYRTPIYNPNNASPFTGLNKIYRIVKPSENLYQMQQSTISSNVILNETNTSPIYYNYFYLETLAKIAFSFPSSGFYNDSLYRTNIFMLNSNITFYVKNVSAPDLYMLTTS